MSNGLDEGVMLNEDPVIKDGKYDKQEDRTAHAMKKTIVSVIAGLLLFKTAQACDVRIHMMHNTVTAVCEGSECTRLPYHFLLRHGQEICLDDHSGERVSLQLTEVVWRFRYELAYYTSDYVDKLTSESACCGSWGCYDERSDCTSRAKSALKQTRGNDTQVVVTCILDGIRFASCAYQSERERKGELSSLFKLKPKAVLVESIKFTVKRGNQSQLITIRDFDPGYELNLSKYKLQHISSISITAIKGRPSYSRSALLEYDNKLYYVNSSEKSAPRDNLIGDFQIHLNKQGKDYNRDVVHRVTCESDGHCGCECSFPTIESMISQFLRRKDSLEQPTNAIMKKNDASIVIDTYETIENNKYDLEIHLGDWEALGFSPMNGKCAVTFLGSYGCSSCNESSYVVFTAQNIENEGLMPFHSNCSFNRNSIKCDYEPTKLVLKGNHDTCYIKLLKSNDQFLINMKYFNFGHQVKPKRQLNCTTTFTGYGEVFVHFVTGTQFIKTSATTMIISLTFGLIANSVRQFFYKRKRQLCTVEKEQDLVEL